MSIPNDGSLVPAFIPYGTTAADMPIRSKVLLTRAHYKKQYRAPGFPVGIASIGSYLESKGIFVRLLDLAVEQDWRTALGKAMAEHAFEIVGISFQITQHEEALQVARDLKQKYPSTKIVIGGSYPSCAPLDCAKNPEFDVVCCAEGELTMIDLLEAWDNGRPLDSVAGIVFRNADGVPVQTTARAVIEDLNQMPLPAFHLLNLDTYIRAERTSDFTNQKHRSMELITSRGCPYHCTFCHTIFGKKFRGRSPQHVASEISLLHEKYQVTEFVIWDDTFTMDVQRAKDICDWITNSGLKITLQLRGGVRVEQMDEELMAKLKRAGVETMCVGVESAVWRVQKMIKKNLKLQKVESFLNLSKKYNITTIGLMMLGFPGETVQEMKESIRWACNSKLDYTFFSMVTPYPGTELYDLVVREGYFTSEGDFNNMNVMIPHMETPECSSKRVKWMQILGYLRFYTKPRRLRKLLSSTYTLKAFVRSLGDYFAIALSYFVRKLGSHSGSPSHIKAS